MNTLIFGKSSFNIEVPFKLIETGETGKVKPLIFYLHGYNDYLESFKKTCDSLVRQIQAYHLFIQGPYPVFNHAKKKKVKKSGSAWYLYDGSQINFIQSMEKTSLFLEKILKRLKKQILSDRTSVVGYSMGGYLAGYFTMTRPNFINDLIIAGARVKTEVLEGNWASIQHLQVLALHGIHDNIVDYKPQRSEIKRLVDNGVSANFKLIDQKHIFNEEFVSEIMDWLYKKGYVHTDSF